MKKSCLSLLGIGAILLVAGVIGASVFFRLPTDHELRDFFTSHREAFVSLQSVLAQDRLIRRITQGEIAIHKEGNQLSDIILKPMGESGLPADHLAKYNDLMAQVGAKTLGQDELGAVYIMTGGWGFAGHGPRWGYCWLPNPPPADMTVASLDDFTRKGAYQPDVTRFVPLDGHWNIFIHAGA